MDRVGRSVTSMLSNVPLTSENVALHEEVVGMVPDDAENRAPDA